MSKKTFSYFIIFFLAIVFLVVVFWFMILQEKSGDGFSVAVPSGSTSVVVSSSSGSGGRVVTNVAGSYRVEVPFSWYVEETGMNQMALYPEYNPSSSLQMNTQPSCKIEISVLSNAQHATLDAWLRAYLHQDPTQDAVVFSQKLMRVSGHDALLWVGALNGVSTTLVYVANGASVYEIAPSVIVGGNCIHQTDAVLASFSIMNP